MRDKKSQARGFSFKFSIDEVSKAGGDFLYGVHSPNLANYVVGGSFSPVKMNSEDLKAVSITIENHSDHPFRNIEVKFPINHAILYNGGITNNVSSNKIEASSDGGVYEVVKTSSSLNNYNSPPVLENSSYKSKYSIKLNNPLESGGSISEVVYIIHVPDIDKNSEIYHQIEFIFEDVSGNKWVRVAGEDVVRAV